MSDENGAVIATTKVIFSIVDVNYTKNTYSMDCFSSSLFYRDDIKEMNFKR